MTKNWAMAVLALALAGCGDSDSKSVKPDDAANSLSAGDYKVSAVSYETFDANQKSGGVHNVQSSGSFLLSIKSISENKFQVIGTGASTFTENNQEIGSYSCTSGRDVYSFEMDSSGLLKNIQVIEANCAVGLEMNRAQTMTIRVVDSKVFVLTVVSIGGGAKTVASYTYTK